MAGAPDLAVRRFCNHAPRRSTQEMTASSWNACNVVVFPLPDGPKTMPRPGVSSSWQSRSPPLCPHTADKMPLGSQKPPRQHPWLRDLSLPSYRLLTENL